jgi:cell filamentation protein
MGATNAKGASGKVDIFEKYALTFDPERLIGMVNGTMAIEYMPLFDDDRKRLRSIMNGEATADEVIQRIITKHRCTLIPDVFEREGKCEWDTMYSYPNAGVLRNKLRISAADELYVAERKIISVRILEAIRKPVRGQLGFKHLCDIHKFVFKDIYDWAGNLRTVNIAKGNVFCNAGMLDIYGAELFSKLADESYLIATPKEMIAKRLAYYLSEINAMHPFREGNGRVQRLFIVYLALIAGYRIDFSDVSAADMIEASARAFDRDESVLVDIIKRSITPITQEEQKLAIQVIAGARSEIMKRFKEASIKRSC